MLATLRQPHSSKIRNDHLHSRWPAWTPAALIVLVAILNYLLSFPGAFILDDNNIVRLNALVADFDVFGILRRDYWYPTENSGLYRPLTILSFAVNRLITGEQVWGYHLVNVLLHAGVSALLWKVLTAWSLSRGISFWAAVLFAVHPLHTEVVNVIVGRSELLVALFLLLGFLLARRDGLRPGLWVCVCYALALLSKEHAITFLGLLPLVDLYRNDGNPRIWRQRWRLYAGLATVAALWLIWRSVGLIQDIPPSVYSSYAVPLAYAPWGAQFLTGLELQWFYLAKLILPIKLQTSYPLTDLPAFVTSIMTLRGFVVAVATLAVFVLIACAWFRCRPVAFFALLYVITFSPTANVLFPIGVTFAERLTYLPSLWFCAGVACLLVGCLDKWLPQRVAIAVLILYISVLAGLCQLRTLEYQSETRLWTAEVEKSPDDVLGWMNLALVLNKDQRYAEAEQAYRRMLALADDFAGGLRSWTGFLMRHGRYAEALGPASQALAIAKAEEDPTGLQYDSADLGHIYFQLGDYETALRYLQSLEERIYDYAFYLGLRAKTLGRLGRHAEAVEDFKSIENLPANSVLIYDYAKSLLMTDAFEEARRLLENSLQQTEDAQRWNLLGVVCVNLNDWKAAKAAFERAVELEPANWNYRDNLQRARTDAN